MKQRTSDDQEYKKAIQRTGFYEIPLLIFLIIGFIQYINGGTKIGVIVILFILACAKMIVTWIRDREALGTIMALSLSYSGFVYVVVLVLLKVM